MLLGRQGYQASPNCRSVHIGQLASDVILREFGWDWLRQWGERQAENRRALSTSGGPWSCRLLRRETGDLLGVDAVGQRGEDHRLPGVVCLLLQCS